MNIIKKQLLFVLSFNNSQNSLKDEFINISFKNKERTEKLYILQKFYKNLLLDFMSHKEKLQNLKPFEKDKAILKIIENFYNTNNKKIDEQNIATFVFILGKINFHPTETYKDYTKEYFHEIEYNNINKFIEISLEEISFLIAMQDLMLDEQSDIEEFTKIYNELISFFYKEKSKISTIKQVINFKEISNKYVYGKKIYFFKNIIFFQRQDIYINKLINECMKKDIISDKDKISISSDIWIAIDFLYDIYNNYFDFIMNREQNFQTEIEILKKIIKFKEKNNLNLTYEEIYMTIYTLFFGLKYYHIDNKNLMRTFISSNDVYEVEILNLENYIKYKIIIASFSLLIKSLTANNPNTLKFTKYNSYINEALGKFVKDLLGAPVVKPL
jgi:hypothetical protein